MGSLLIRWNTMFCLPLLLFTAGCLVGDERCGKNQVENTQGIFDTCVCKEGTIPSADNKRCEPCQGAFEQAVEGACQCIVGYQRVGGTCMPAAVVPDAGDMSDAGDAAMSGPLTGTMGQGDSCQSNADCAGKDATWCVNLRPPFQCFVQNCANGQRACSAGRVCCDLSGLVAPLAAANGLCLETANCAPIGGRVVQ
jgi:hypothetical protein